MNERPDQLEGGLHRMTRQKKGASRGVIQTYDGQPLEDGLTVVGFDTDGNYTSQRDQMVAKRVEHETYIHYYVKFGTDGADLGHMLNPYGLYFDQADIGREQHQKGRGRYEFKRVEWSAFDDYIRFLRSRVESHLRSAERKVLDA